MTRYLPLALVVFGLAGCGSDDNVTLTLRYTGGLGQAASPRLVKATARALDARLDRIGLEEARVEASGRRLKVTLPKEQSARAERILLARGKLTMYDWEPNVVGEDGRVDVEANAVGGGYGIALNPERAAMAAEAAAGETVTLRSPPPERGKPPQRYFVLLDRPALGPDDLAGVKADNDKLLLGFTPEGQTKFTEATREIALRGADHAPVTGPTTGYGHHFALAVDDAILAVPYIDFHENPDGIDGETGVQISMTKTEAEDLAALLIAPLAAPLEIVSSG